MPAAGPARSAASSGSARPSARPAGASLRARLIAGATELTAAEGWAKVTMGRLAQHVGVSRQTVYNEIGTKPALAEAMVLTELERFLGVVDEAFDAHPDDLVEAIRAAAAAVLEIAVDNQLLHAVVSATHGADTELLPLLTTHADSLLGTAKAVVAARVSDYSVTIPDARMEGAIDMVVRVVLSHVMQPSGTPTQTADDLAWIASRALAL